MGGVPVQILGPYRIRGNITRSPTEYPPYERTRRERWDERCARLRDTPFAELPAPLLAKVASYAHYDKTEVHLSCLSRRCQAACRDHAADFMSRR